MRSVLYGQHDLPGGWKAAVFLYSVDHEEGRCGHSGNVRFQDVDGALRRQLGNTVCGGDVGGDGGCFVSELSEGTGAVKRDDLDG